MPVQSISTANNGFQPNVDNVDKNLVCSEPSDSKVPIEDGGNSSSLGQKPIDKVSDL
jgi:hypothetical protein